MGKAKGKGSGSGGGGGGGGGKGGRGGAAPYQKQDLGQDRDSAKERSNGLVADLTSLDEQRRVNACRLISGVFESSGGASFEALVTRPLLGALAMRLLDQSSVVRLDAAGALRNMACSANANVTQKMADAGVVRTMLGLLSSCCGEGEAQSEAGATQGRVAEQLLGGLAGLVSACDEACDELVQHAQAVPLLLQLAAGSGRLGPAVRRGAAELLATATDGAGSAEVGRLVEASGGVALLLGVVSSNGAGAAERGAEAETETEAEAATRAHAVVACGGVLVNLYTGAQEEGLRLRCGLQQVLERLMSLAQLSPDTLALLASQAAAAAAAAPVAAAVAEEEEEVEGGLDGEEEDAMDAEDIPPPEELSKEAQEEDRLLRALAVAKAAAEVVANVGILLPSREQALQAPPSSQQLLAFCTSHNLFGACGKMLLEHFELLKTLTSNNTSNNAISAVTLAVAENMDTLCAVLVNLVESHSGSLTGNEGLLAHMVSLTDFLMVCVHSTLTTVDGATGRKSTVWDIDTDSGVSSTGAMKTFAQAAASCMGFVASVLRNPEFQGHVDDAFVKSLLALLLRGMALPVYNVASVCVLVITVIGSRSLPVNAVLTNTLLKKMEAPLVFKERETGSGSVMNWDASVLMVGQSIDAIIDIHSSDDEGLLSNFVKFNVASKLSEAVNLLVTKMNHEDAQKLDAEERTNMAEVIENATNFLEYKSQFIK